MKKSVHHFFRKLLKKKTFKSIFIKLPIKGLPIKVLSINYQLKVYQLDQLKFYQLITN